MPADGGCKHSLGGAHAHDKCNGVEGSYEAHIFTFRAGQLATLDSFQQRATLLASAGIQEQDPMYGDKLRCLPRSVVRALTEAAQPGPMPLLYSPEQPIPAAKVKLQVGSWGAKRSYIECEDWQDLLLLFPALKDRHHASHAILLKHWRNRKIFSPVNPLFWEEPLEFVQKMAVCACHIHPDDVQHRNRIAGTVSLKPDARLRSADFFKRTGSTGTERANPFERSPGNTPLAKHLSSMYKDTLDQLVELQRTTFEARVDEEVDSLREQIEILKAEVLTASNMLKAASDKASLYANDALMSRKSSADSLLKTTALTQALTSALDSEQKANVALDEANDALAAANETVKYISNGLCLDNISMFGRLRAASTKLASESKNKVMPWTHDSVQAICSAADAPQEYARFLSMFEPKPNSVAQKSGGKDHCRERRAIVAFFIALGATSERFGLLRNAVDKVLTVPRSQQALISNLGFGTALSTSDRQDRRLLDEYLKSIDVLFSDWLNLPLTCTEDEIEKFLSTWAPLICLISWCDDFVRNWSRDVFRSADQRAVRIFWAVIAIKKGNLPPARPISGFANDHFRDPLFLDVPRLLEHVQGGFLLLGLDSILDKMLTQHETLLTFLSDRTSILERGDSHKYSKASPASMDRHMGEGDVQLVDILDQSFKTYLEMLRAMMTLMTLRSVFLYLTQFIMVSPLDHPAFRAFAMLTLQGDGRGGFPVGYYLGHLMFVSDATTFKQITVNIPDYLLRKALEDMPTTYPLYLSKDTDELLLYAQKVCIGKAAMNVHYEIDPLHIFINARKDAANWWNDILLGPLFQKITKAKYKDKMSMAEIESLEDVLLAAWLNVRKHMLPALKAVAHSRFDVSAFIWHMEVSLSIPVILYDFLLRQEGAGEAYYQVLLFALLETIVRQRHNYPAALCRKIGAVLYLNLKNHDQARVLLKGCHIMDAAFGEHGVNALLRIILQGVTSTEQAIKKAKLHFAKRSSAVGRGVAHDLGSNHGSVKYVLGRSMDIAVVHAQNLLGAIVESLIGAENANKLPRRVKYTGAKRFKSDAYSLPAFFPDYVLDILPADRKLKAQNGKFPSHQIAAPAFALNARSYENRGVSPDERRGCHVKGCATVDPLHYLICGHSRCYTCFERSQHCSDCVEGAAKRIEHVAKVEAQTERERFITVKQLRETTLTAQEQAEADEAEASCVQPADDAPPPPPDAAGAPPPPEAAGAISISIEENRVKVTLALEQALAGRRDRAAVAAERIAHPHIVPPIALAGAAAPDLVPMEGDHEPVVGGNVRRKQGRRVEETVTSVPLVGGPAVQPVPVALCGFPKRSKNGADVPCVQFAAHCGYSNHKRWRLQKESAPSLSELSEPAISAASAHPQRLNSHIIFDE